MTKQGAFSPFQFTATTTITVDTIGKVGVITFVNTGDEDITTTSIATTSSAFVTSATFPATVVFAQSFVDGTTYYKDVDGSPTTDATQTGIQIGVGTAANTLYINISKATCLNRYENQVELLLSGNNAYDDNILMTVPCIKTLKAKRGRSLYLTGN